MAKAKAPPFKSTGYWLLKSEAETYSIDQFKKDKKTLWTGVRNYQARNFMVDSMKPGEKFVFYHSSSEPSAAVGLGEITKVNQPDPTAWDKKDEYHDPKATKDAPIWYCAEVAYKGHLARPVSLPELRAEPRLEKMALLQRGQRLSILPLTKEEYELIVAMSEPQALERNA